MKHALWLIILIVLAALIGLLIFDPAVDPDENGEPVNGNDEELSVVEALLAELPYETTVEGRTIPFDRASVEQAAHEEYAPLPYEVQIGDETRPVESDMELLPGESPLEFTERFVEASIPPQEELGMYPDTMYRYSVSFYEMDGDEVSAYPADDNETAEMAEEGVSAYVRVMNFPDDSIGGNEHRFDFIVSSGGAWVSVWHGERNFCRRPGNEFWQPANELCP